MYNKKCRYCGKEFESESRNTRYCSTDCCDKAQTKMKKVKKQRERKRTLYHEDKDVSRLVSRAYALSQDMAEIFIPKVCADPDCECHKLPVIEVEFELHHKDCNPFHITFENMEWRCEKAHKRVHTTLPNVNMLEVLKDIRKEMGHYDVEKESVLDQIRAASNSQLTQEVK